MLPLPEKSGLYYIILLYEMQDREKIQQKNYVLCFGEQNNRPQYFRL